MGKPKIMALYLPQFHCIPENDEFWGKGFTDWVTVKRAKPLFGGHIQPRVPLNDNYYDLSLSKNVEWQAELAYKYGVYGFGVYHYWFNNEKNLLTRPAEIMRDDVNVKVKYFFVWDNANWKRSWSNVSGNAWAPIAEKDAQKGPQILIPYILGGKQDWKKHYDYVSTHFKSDRYIKTGNKPIFCIIGYDKDMTEMCTYWNQLAKEDGFEGMSFIFKESRFKKMPETLQRYSYEPHSSGWWKPISFWKRVSQKLSRIYTKPQPFLIYDYDNLWEQLLDSARKHKEPTHFPGAFVSYDDSPRRGTHHSIIVNGSSPSKFGSYFSELYKIASKQNKEFIFLTAWNEWGEGAYLEPDEYNGYAYLEEIRKVIK